MKPMKFFVNTNEKKYLYNEFRFLHNLDYKSIPMLLLCYYKLHQHGSYRRL